MGHYDSCYAQDAIKDWPVTQKDIDQLAGEIARKGSKTVFDDAGGMFALKVVKASKNLTFVQHSGSNWEIYDKKDEKKYNHRSKSTNTKKKKK